MTNEPMPQTSTMVPPYQPTGPQTSYVVQNQPEPKRVVRPIPGILYFAIATLVIALFLLILGSIAIYLKAWDSYLGDPIWSAILFLLPTGILGMTSHWKKTSLCVNVSYFAMCIVTCVDCFQLLVYASIDAAAESWWYCSPRLRFVAEDCRFSPGERIAVDSLIAVFALIQLVICIITLSLTCYRTFACCYYCCQPTPPAVVQYIPQTGACQLVSVGGYQSPAGYQQVSLMIPVGQGGQMMASALPVMTQTQIQSHPVLYPATMVPQPTNQPCPGPNPHVQPTAPATEKNTDPSSEPIPHPLSELVHTPEEALSYGQTATDFFHEERNLLDSV